MEARRIIPTVAILLLTISILPLSAQQCTSDLQCPPTDFCQRTDGDCYGPGICAEKPGFCADFYSPVCGCDGITYSNACYAARAGASVSYGGECTQTCGGFAGIQCPRGEYCNLDGCYPDAAGHCEIIPDSCSRLWDPVCGCDGGTYSNPCQAAMSQMTVDYEGECSTSTPCTGNAQCPSDSYCSKAPEDCSGEGQCLEKPLACPAIYDPVCGCDGTTYGNECEAAAAGINVDYEGECTQFCGGIAGLSCDEGEYCNLDGCYPDAGGQCETMPNACPDVWDPVCGCNGVTYGNACEAAMAQVTVDHKGECSTTNPCTENNDCPSDSYCAKDDSNCEGAGECQTKPTICPNVWDPVCGCDGITYGNECEANAAGVNVDHKGECSTLCTENNECPQDSYCAKTDSDCDAAGECQPKPTICPDVWDPVCGCDGVTYGNECEANAAGVNVDHEGECLPPGPTIIMKDPNAAPDDVHTGPSGIDKLRILWSEPIIFGAADIAVLNEHAAPVPFSFAGNNTKIMTIVFGNKLLHDKYTITIEDSALSMISGLAIDGDNNGASGGDAIVVMEHRLRTDSNNNNRINFIDVAFWMDTWLAELD